MLKFPNISRIFFVIWAAMKNFVYELVTDPFVRLDFWRGTLCLCYILLIEFDTDKLGEALEFICRK